MMNTPFRSVTAAGNPLTHLVEQARRLQRWAAARRWRRSRTTQPRCSAPDASIGRRRSWPCRPTRWRCEAGRDPDDEVAGYHR